jgi:hypothetical protein
MNKFNETYNITRAIVFIGLTFLSMSCGRPNRAQNLLEEDEARGELYMIILNDHRYLTQFMDSMNHNNHARMMMKADTGFVSTIMEHSDVKTMMGHVMKKVENDSVKSKEMCSMMAEHKAAMKFMMEIMRKKGLLENGKENKKEPESHKEHH